MGGNPFNYGMPVSGKQFVGRWAQIKAGLVAYKVLVNADAWLTQSEVEQSIQDAQLSPQIGLALYNLCYHGLAIHDGSWTRYHVTGQLFGDWFVSEKLPSLSVPTVPLLPPNTQTNPSNQRPIITYEILPIISVPSILCSVWSSVRSGYDR